MTANIDRLRGFLLDVENMIPIVDKMKAQDALDALAAELDAAQRRIENGEAILASANHDVERLSGALDAAIRERDEVKGLLRDAIGQVIHNKRSLLSAEARVAQLEAALREIADREVERFDRPSVTYGIARAALAAASADTEPRA